MILEPGYKVKKATK